ncbi:DUF6279 family lipoprotein [Candidatus Thiosymbion oneisti]|uniref:DUF6279 family lipoprotein n=1 Tax=Candidatus Thiosymbion oneisti TaxID=589554 RepID=UPI00106120FB|nr:DUF6279 family lipoprotein [Candidatus Thiosymbion oneisti]
MRFRRIFVLLLVSLLVVGCSRVSIFYRTLDLFIEKYADDYLSLDRSQLAAWRPTLADGLARHRREELPHLAAFFGGLYDATQAGFKAAGTECLLDAFEDLYRRHFRLAAELAAPLLVSLSPQQIRGLERKFAEEARDEAEKNRDLERRLRKRAERWSESVEWWIGPLTGAQRQIIRKVTRAMPDTAADWAAYRGARRARLIRLLDRQAGEAEIRRYLTDWLADHKDLPPPLRTAKQGIRRQIVRLFVRLDASFSRTQRTHFKERLANLRDDFMGLQKNPRMAPLSCAR